MHVQVTPMRKHGVALDPKERRRYPAIRGNVMVNSTVCPQLGRAANIARVEVGMPLDPIHYRLYWMPRSPGWPSPALY